MLRTRVIPVLLLKGKGLVKTKQFKNPNYIGDPINAVRIFNDKEVDELVFLDIIASKENTQPKEDLLKTIAEEAFMPLAYGGGINCLSTAARLLHIGVEKLILNSLLFTNLGLVKEMSDNFGSQSIVASIDVKKSFWSKTLVYSHSGQQVVIQDPVDFSKKLEDAGVGEIMLNSVDNDGMMQGYDLKLIKSVTDSVEIPVIASGGASSMDDFVNAINQAGASAVAAGSMFVYRGKHNAVLINYPPHQELEKRLK